MNEKIERQDDKIVVGWDAILNRASDTSGMSVESLEASYDAIHTASIDLFHEVKDEAFKSNKSVVLEMKNTLIVCTEVDEHLEKDIHGESIRVNKSVGVRTGISEKYWVDLNEPITLSEIVVPVTETESAVDKGDEKAKTKAA